MIEHRKLIGRFEQTDIGGLADELKRRHEARRDFIFRASSLKMTVAGLLVLASVDTFRVDNIIYTSFEDASKAADELKAEDGQYRKIEPLGKTGEMPISDTAEAQLCEKLEIPIKYIRSLRDRQHPALAAENFNVLMASDKRRFLVRTLDGKVRAILGDRYRCMDNNDLFFLSAEQFQQVGADFWTARLGENGFQILGVNQKMRGVVRTDRPFDTGGGWQSFWHGKEGDVHHCAVNITNSETGKGGLNIGPAILRDVCVNFYVWADSYGFIHAGRKHAEEGLLNHLGLGDSVPGGAEELLSDETRRAEDRTIMLKIRDIIRGTFDPERFTAYIEKLNGATQQEIKKPEKAVENVAYEFGLSDERRSAILSELLRSGDRSRYGMSNAITFAAKAADKDNETEIAQGLEEIGASIIDMDDKEFDVLAERNPPARKRKLATVS